jgi:hypothetical protein
MTPAALDRLCHEAIFLVQSNPGPTGPVGAPTYPMQRDATQATMFVIRQQENIGYDFLKSENRVPRAFERATPGYAVPKAAVYRSSGSRQRPLREHEGAGMYRSGEENTFR